MRIVERLRAPAYWMSGSSEGHEGENDAPREAAALIEELVEALEHIANMSTKGLYGSFRKPAIEVAKSALAKAHHPEGE